MSIRELVNEGVNECVSGLENRCERDNGSQQEWTTKRKRSLGGIEERERVCAKESQCISGTEQESHQGGEEK